MLSELAHANLVQVLLLLVLAVVSSLLHGCFSNKDVASVSSDTDKACFQVPEDHDGKDWFGKGLASNKAFWKCRRGIGFSPADDRGEWFMKRADPKESRLEDALKKVVANGYNMIRTWRTGSYEELILKTIDEQSLDIKVQLGVDIVNKWDAQRLIDAAGKVAEKYKHLVLGMSVGNERIYGSAFWGFDEILASDVLEHARYAKSKYGVPVTYNFVVKTITHSESNWRASNYYDLVKELDYVNVHLYGGHYDGRRNQRDWTPQKQVEAVQQQEREVQAKIGDLNKPIIIGESGWQSRMYAVSSVCNLREYYIRITRHVYSGNSLAQAMFFFNLNDEAWKGADDSWGLYLQGNEEKIGDANGKAKFTPTDVKYILENEVEETCQPDPCYDAQAPIDGNSAATCGSRIEWVRNDQGKSKEGAEQLLCEEEPVNCKACC